MDPTGDWSGQQLAEFLAAVSSYDERLFRIQRSISHRAPITEVLDSITDGASELLGDDVIGLRLVDPDDAGMLLLVSSRGMSLVVPERPGALAGTRRAAAIC